METNQTNNSRKSIYNLSYFHYSLVSFRVGNNTHKIKRCSSVIDVLPAPLILK